MVKKIKILLTEGKNSARFVVCVSSGPGARHHAAFEFLKTKDKIYVNNFY